MILAQHPEASGTLINFSGKDLLGFLGVILGAIFAYLGTKVSSRSQVASKRIESSGPQWEAFVEKMEAQQENYIKKIKEMNELDLLKMSNRVSKLETDYTSIKEEMDTLKMKYDQAVSVLRKIYEKDKSFFEDMDIPIDLWLDIKKDKNKND